MRARRHLVLVATALLATAPLATACDDARLAPLDGSPPPPDASLPPGVDGGPGPGPGTDAGRVGPISPLVDPACTDGMFTEILPDGDADISDLVAGYSSEGAVDFLIAALDRRYPTGAALIEGGRARQDCAAFFLRDTSSAEGALGDVNTVVHECGHFYDLDLSGGGSNTYVLNDSPLELTCAQGDTTSRGGLTFARSRIVDDAWSSARPACGGGGAECDHYADIYLDGDPDDAAFEGGDQGFNMLYEEAVQYVHSLATALAFTNELNVGGRRTSMRDGILTFLWYLERYLNMARLEYPSAYAQILSGDGGCWRDAVLTLWGQAWLYLEVTAEMSHLGISDVALEALVKTPELLEEIQRLRDAAGCGG